MKVSFANDVENLRQVDKGGKRDKVVSHLPLKFQTFLLVVEHQSFVVALDTFEGEYPLLCPTGESLNIPATLAHQTL